MLWVGEIATLQGLSALSLLCGAAYPTLPSGWLILRAVTKTTAILVLAVLAALGGAPLLAAALALSALGDLALARPSDRAFLIGMGAFGAAHVVYATLFAGLGDAALIATPLRAAAVIGLLIFASVVAARLSRGAGPFRWPLRAYVALIAAMGVSALMLSGGPGTMFIWAGAALFITSDVLIGHERFAGLGFRGLGLAIWGLYYAGQVLILLGVLAQI